MPFQETGAKGTEVTTSSGLRGTLLLIVKRWALGGSDFGRCLLLRRIRIPRLDFLPDRQDNAQADTHDCQELRPDRFSLYHGGCAMLSTTYSYNGIERSVRGQ